MPAEVLHHLLQGFSFTEHEKHQERLLQMQIPRTHVWVVIQ